MQKLLWPGILGVIFWPAAVLAQEAVSIHVNANAKLGLFKPIWSYFGYDEPNYTYMKNGRKLISELSAMNYPPVYIRTHFLLTSGDATPGLKWGSTNAYAEDAAGKPTYDWKIVDRILDTYIEAKAKPFVEIGFMPKALSSKPEPYQPLWIPGAPNRDYAVGWSYPPKDYEKWAALIYQWVRHSIDKYGKQEVDSWYWEVWNEPDISYWHGTPEEYDTLYDYTAAAVKRALPSARVGGPASTGPSGSRAAAFLRQFLEHCDHGINRATGGSGAPLDFITYHAKGRPAVDAGHVRMGISKQAQDVEKGYEIVASFQKFRNLPVVLSESDPEGCAACSARVYPPNGYRNSTLYPVYTAVMLKTILELAEQQRVNITGVLTWAFEFEEQPYFDGFRTLATNGVDKPVLNVFRMWALMSGDRVGLNSNARVPLDEILNSGVRQKPDIDGLAVSSDRDVSVMTWNYHDDDVPAADALVHLTLDGVPATAKKVQLHHYRIDGDHSNAYTTWKEMASPQNPTLQQYARLQSAGQLQLLESPRWIPAEKGKVEISFALPRQAISLLQVSW